MPVVSRLVLADSCIDTCLSSVHLLQICSKMEVVDKPESYKKLGTKWQGNGLVGSASASCSGALWFIWQTD